VALGHGLPARCFRCRISASGTLGKFGHWQIPFSQGAFLFKGPVPGTGIFVGSVLTGRIRQGAVAYLSRLVSAGIEPAGKGLKRIFCRRGHSDNVLETRIETGGTV
jgi:hypothetical protein